MKYTPDFSSRFRILKGGKISLVVSALVAGSTMTFASPTGGQVTSGSASIAQNGSITTINQSSNKASINWNSFSIAPTETVNFVQPSASSVTLNRVVGTTQSLIQGAMNANGQVFLINPNGVLFANGSSVNVGGLVASTLNLTDANFQAGNYVFEGNSQNSVLNMGTITASNGGYVAMMGKTVQNEGTIVATMGNVQMASGEKISLNLNGSSLVKLTIDQGTLNALVENKGLIKADGGQVYLTTQALNTILDGMVNNTGVIEAQSLNNVDGKVILFAHGGTANIGGTIKAEGGFVETSGNKVKIADDFKVIANNWLIDPVDFTIAASGGDMTGATLSSNLATADVTIQSSSGSSGVDGDININDAVSWSSAKVLQLIAYRNININADITASNANAALALSYGQGAVAAGNTADYNIARGVKINLQPGYTFTTMLGTGANIDWYNVVNTAADLQNINSSLSSNFALGSNVDLSGVTWTTIGNGSAAFTGKFDGLGHAVDHLTISTAIAGSDGAGLFGNVANATLKNIGVTNVNINAALSDGVGGLVGSATDSTIIKNAYSTGSVTGQNWVGGLVGFFTSNSNLSTAIIENSNSTASVNGVANVGGLAGNLEEITTRNNYATGNVNSTGDKAGGLFGSSYGSTINTSYASGNVTGATDKVGGLIGNSDTDTIANVYAIGNVTGANMVGGLLGAIAGTGSLTNGYASGVVTGTGVDVGGLIGKIPYGAPTVATSYWDTTTTSKSTSAGGETGIANTDAYTQSIYSGFDFINTWFMVDGYTRHFLRMEASNTITNAHELQLMSMNLGNSYTLANNINLAPSLTNASEMWRDFTNQNFTASNFKGGFMPIYLLPDASTRNYFTGSFDGQNHTISNLYIDRIVKADSAINYTSGVGLFGRTQNATISNLTVTGQVTGTDSVGGIVGYANGGTYSNLHFSGDVLGIYSDSQAIGGLIGSINDTGARSTTISDSSFTGTVSGQAGYTGVGGLVGYDWHATQIPTTISNSHVVNAIINGTGSHGVGGLVGYTNRSTISDSDVSGTVTGLDNVGGLVGYSKNGTISNSHSAANTTGTADNVGGLVGYLEDAAGNRIIIENSYASGSVIGSNYIGGLVGYARMSAENSNSNIEKSFSIGSVTGHDDVGGLIGFIKYINLNNSYASGDVTGNDRVAGFIGENFGSHSAVSNSYSSGQVTGTGSGIVAGFIGYGNAQHSITNSFWDVDTSGQTNGGYSTGWSYAAIPGLTGKTTAEMKTFTTFSDTTPAWDIVVDASLSNVYPKLRWATTGLSAGSSVWVIGTALAPTPTSNTVVDNVVTAIVNQATVTPPRVANFTPLSAPSQSRTETQKLMNAIMPDKGYELVSSPNGLDTVKAMDSSELQAVALANGMNELRIPLGNGSLVDLVNGGLNLPKGVNQEFYVVDNSSNSTATDSDDQNQKSKKN